MLYNIYTMKNGRLYNKALKLRKLGFSYGEIKKKLGIAKSTASMWFRSLKLGAKALKRLKVREFRGKIKALETVKRKIALRNDHIEAKVILSLKNIKLTKDSIKLLCSILYWAEGEKSGSAVSFTNSDPAMIKLYLALFRKSFEIDHKKLKAVLHLHPYHNVKKQLIFWSKITGIPIKQIFVYNKHNSGKNIRKDYPGCIAIRYFDVKIYKEIEFYYKSFAKNLGA